jgi:RNA polymerase sigma-70 factor (ECF subfamily)
VLLERIGAHLRGYYKARLTQTGRGMSEAEELVQETLIAIRTRRHTWDADQPFTPWLYAIARYKLIDHLRRTKASRGDLPIEDAGEITAHNDRADAESAIDLGRLLERLPARMRRAIQDVKLSG